eukprot:gene29349-36538_t
MCFGCQERRTTRVLAMELGYRVSWDHMPEPVFNFSSGVVEGSEAASALMAVAGAGEPQGSEAASALMAVAG